MNWPWTTLNWSVGFDAPQYLLLLAILPMFWLIGRRSLQALGEWRQRSALLLRLTVASLMVIALAEPNWLTLIHRVTVLFLVDASDSIQPDELAHALDYVNSAVDQRRTDRGDRAGVVVFGRDATVEVPPLNHEWRIPRIESHVDPRFTNLESALKLAQATFPSDSAKRVVIISDGNENTGHAEPQASALLDSGIGIDCVPISYERQGDVRVEKVVVPSDIRRGVPFQLRVVLNNLSSDRAIAGKLRIMRHFGGSQHLVSEEQVRLEPGKKVLTLPQQLSESGISTYEARFVPDNPAEDVHSENNVATGFSSVGGKGHVLLIEDASLAGRFDTFVQLLRANDIEVTLRDTRQPFVDLADLQQFDCVILADVARIAGEETDNLTQFSDSQIRALVQNTEHFGAGLIVLGGPNSYGAGGWTNTELEKALPVDCQIDNAKVEAVGALVLVIDSSGSMSGPKIAWSKAAAVAASRMLGKRDYLGVVAFDSEARWIVPLRRNDASLRAQARIDQLGAGGGTNMMPGLELAYRAIQNVEASLKHVIVLSDGQTPPDRYASLVSGVRARNITTTAVAVGPDADRALLAEIANRGGGKFYHVVSPNVIPRIFMREARQVATPLMFEDRNGIAVEIASANEVLSGVSTPPPVTGYVLTTVKQHPLVEVLLATPRQPQPNSTILATWRYGLGRTAAWTTDIGQRWATEWPTWGNYQKLLLQIVRSTMRAHDLTERLVMSAEVRDGGIEVVVNSLDQDNLDANLLQLSGTVILPTGESQPFAPEQVAPGRYTARLPAQEPGNYYLSVSAGNASAPLRTAVSVPPSVEHNDLVSADRFLAQLAEGTPRGGERGRVIQSPQGLADTETLLKTDVFRPGLPPAESRNSMWPLLLVIASVAFLGDVFCRRVAISFTWLSQLYHLLAGQVKTEPERTETSPMERLKRTKATAAPRFEVGRGFPLDTQLEPTSVATASAQATAPATQHSLSATTAAADESASKTPEFTARLLEIKRRMRDQEQRPKS
jgi:Mg-chelatase subunit ChlD